MWIKGSASASSPAAIFNLQGPGMCNPTNSQIPIQLMPELKLNWDKLKLAIFAQQHGIEPWVSCMTVIGGYARNPAEGAITLIANVLGNWGFSHGSTSLVWSTDMRGNWNAKKDLQWTNCAAIKALDANVGNIVYSFGSSSAGPMTEMSIYEAAVYSLAYTASGIEVILGGILSRGMGLNRAAGLQGQFVAEVSTASAGLDRDVVNTLLNTIYMKYEHLLDDPPKGVEFCDCYDHVRIKPKPELVSLYDKVKHELGEMGVPFAY
jgi:methylamine--corrinoid protein Co-methyltransferase